MPVSLACNYLINPLGLHDAGPRLSWQLAPVAGRRGQAQSAYRIEVSSRSRGPADLWDSGRVASEATTQIPYQGRRLPSRTRAYWRVTSWDERGVPVYTDQEAFWETGLLSRRDWQARWIGGSWCGSGQSAAPAPYLRRRFTLRRRPVKARLYATALGLYEAYLGGRRVGADVFTPGWTEYAKRVQYQVYDVTAQVKRGRNVFGAILGDGWYCGHIGQKGRQIYGDRPKFFAQLEVTFADGSREIIATDSQWEVARGPILESDFLMGESYDARQELAGWLDPRGGSGEWWRARVFPDPAIDLSPVLTGAVRAHERLPAVADPVTRDGWASSRHIYDFGQNLVGNVTLRIKAKAGTTVILRYAEMLDPAGDLYLENLRTARATDYYTCRGDPRGEEWTPRFTFHGFRYAELSGLAATPGREALVATVLHSELPATGDFSCSDPLINQLQRNIVWGQRGNYLEVPTDCPQRDERLGWTGDAQAFIRTGAWNRHVAAFFTKWQRDIADAQRPDGAVPAVVPYADLVPADGGPAWADAAIICPWTVYQCYADRALLSAHYESLRRFGEFLLAQSRHGIRLHPALRRWGGFGDWLALDDSGLTDGGTPRDLIGTAFYAYDARLLAKIAGLLGKRGDEIRFRRLAENVKRAFQKRFVSRQGIVKGRTQTGYVLALHFDLVPPALRPRLVARLVADIRRRGNKLSTGFVGTPYLLHVLTQANRLDVAYALLHQKKWPSWLYAVTQGATTIWERWDGWTKEKGFQSKGMNSFNHYAYGAVGDWLYATVAGVDLDPAEPGYKHIVLKPRPGGGLTWARGSLNSPHGEIVSEWRLTARTFLWQVTVPPNTRATLHFPVRPGAHITEQAAPAQRIPCTTVLDGGVSGPVWKIRSGQYSFVAKW